MITPLFLITKMMSRIIMMDPSPQHMDLIRDPVCISCKGTSGAVPSQHSSPSPQQSKHSVQQRAGEHQEIIKATAGCTDWCGNTIDSEL